MDKKGLDNIPNLISIVISALPHLNLVSASQAAIRQIEAFMHVGPGDAIVGRNRVLLVLVAR